MRGARKITLRWELGEMEPLVTKQQKEKCYENEYDDLKREYESLMERYKFLETRANIYREDAKLARNVVVEYVDALTITKADYKGIIKDIHAIIENDFILESTKLSRIKRIVNKKKDMATIKSASIRKQG